MRTYSSTSFFGIEDVEKFYKNMQNAVNSLHSTDGVYLGDNVFTHQRNLSFLDDMELMNAHARHCSSEVEKALLWRISIILWGFRNGLSIEGDFVECYSGRGNIARIICDTVNFNTFKDRRYYLYDPFDPDGGLSDQDAVQQQQEAIADAKERFASFDNVIVTRGTVPGIMELVAPRTVAFLHLLLHSREAEIGTLEFLFERMSPGAIVLLDHFGWLHYRAQRQALEAWFSKRGYHVLELPTGQGLVIK
ncbi:hypothetical protein MCEMSEM23_01094 [Rhabdaerophilaceae bacterium]